MEFDIVIFSQHVTCVFCNSNLGNELSFLPFLRNVALSDPNSDSDGSTDSQSEIDEADRAQQEENKNPVSAAAYQSSSPTKKDRVKYQAFCFAACLPLMI